MQKENNIDKLVDHLFRHESGKMVAVLSGVVGLERLDLAHDIVQEALLQAMNTWRFKGIPDNPSAWLYRVARNKALDFLRRENIYRRILPAYAYLSAESDGEVPLPFAENEIRDNQLRMMFAACHPAIPEDSSIAFTLKTLCGLSTKEIARTFLIGEETITKRIYRAREKFRLEKIELELPENSKMAERTDAVLKCLYLLFNEGYNSSHPDQLIREDLCQEAMRLCHLLTLQPYTRFPRVFALLALMCFQASRLNARLDDHGQIIVLKFQDRKKWNQSLIKKGFDYLEQAAEPFEVSTYHLEAAIASTHAAAISFEQTNWKSIYHLYEMLYQLQPNPIVAMNKAIASSYAIDKNRALNELLQIAGLDSYYLYNTAVGELYFEMKDWVPAIRYYEKAMMLTPTLVEKELLKNKIQQCEQFGDSVIRLFDNE